MISRPRRSGSMHRKTRRNSERVSKHTVRDKQHHGRRANVADVDEDAAFEDKYLKTKIKLKR